MSWLFHYVLFLRLTPSAYTISLTPTVRLPLGWGPPGTQPAISAHLSIITRHSCSRAGHGTTMLITAFTLPLCFPSLSFRYNLCLNPLRLYLANTRSPFAPPSLHIRRPFLLSTFHFIFPIPLFHCLVPRPTSQYLSPFLIYLATQLPYL